MHRRLLPAAAWLAVATCALALESPAADLPAVRWQGRTMGSPYTVQIIGLTLSPDALDALKADIEARLKEINRQMSHYEPDSELSRFNRAAAHAPFKVSPEFARVVDFSLDMARRSEGAFDPTLGPVINLWGFGEKTDGRAVPSARDLEAALAATGWRRVSVTERGELVKDRPGLTLNLSAVAKGFAVDELVRLLQGRGWTNLYVAIAGEVRVSGSNSRGTRWQVGISAPVEHWREDDPMAAVVALTDGAISTSGDYQKFFRDAEGRRLGHIFDPRTGWPVQHNLAGVSVVAPDSTTADALGTTLFVLGPETGMKFIEGITNAAALFIVPAPDGSFRHRPSSRFAAMTGWKQ